MTSSEAFGCMVDFHGLRYLLAIDSVSPAKGMGRGAQSPHRPYSGPGHPPHSHPFTTSLPLPLPFILWPFQNRPHNYHRLRLTDLDLYCIETRESFDMSAWFLGSSAHPPHPIHNYTVPTDTRPRATPAPFRRLGLEGLGVNCWS